MVEIDSSAILVKPMQSRKVAKMIRAYNALLLQLRRVGITPKKHVMDNEVSETMKKHIRDYCKLELVPPGCHRRNLVEVAIQNFQDPLPQCPRRCSGRLSTKSMGLPTAANQNHSKPSSPIKRHANRINLCTPQRAIRLQQNATSPNGLRSPSTQEIRHFWNLGIPLSGWMVPVHLPRPLSNASLPHQVHPK